MTEFDATSASAVGVDSMQYNVLYESTPHTFSITEDPNPPQITVTDMFGDGSALILHNYVTPNEIAQFKRQAETFGLRSSGYPSAYRVCNRISAKVGTFANVLFRRVLPFVGDISIAHAAAEGGAEDNADDDRVVVATENNRAVKGVPDTFRAGTTWKPVGLNPVFRAVRYDPGGFFYPHHDFGFHVDRRNKSAKTLMVYLNSNHSRCSSSTCTPGAVGDGSSSNSSSNGSGDASLLSAASTLPEGTFSGGVTSFYRDGGVVVHYKDPAAALARATSTTTVGNGNSDVENSSGTTDASAIMEREVLYQYTPMAGDCLVFNHAQLHDGGRVEAGQKWILRSEVMYQQCQSAPPPPQQQVLAQGEAGIA